MVKRAPNTQCKSDHVHIAQTDPFGSRELFSQEACRAVPCSDTNMTGLASQFLAFTLDKKLTGGLLLNIKPPVSFAPKGLDKKLTGKFPVLGSLTWDEKLTSQFLVWNSELEADR